ncbi:hypothetical protein lbkm_3484 [Lachnospiraceae bacterium KM106-2]|nr:hypothetical protein lbkm_3484 [Lachnospiraceae bacterium KM106-2]
MDNNIYEAVKEQLTIDLVEGIISNSSNKEACQKMKIRPVQIKGEILFQLSSFCGQKVLHQNYTKEEFLEKLPELIEGEITFRQIEIKSKTALVVILISKKGKATIKKKTVKQPIAQKELSHNRSKKYILEQGIPVPFLVDLGIMTKEGTVVKAKYDKYRQINRFLEFIEDVLPSLPKDRRITILDFGCGKSYLTFAMYYYLKELKQYNLQIIGLDLKEDVIKTCNELCERYGYDEMHFLQGDIASYNEVDQVDMVVTLHACDTATDHALFKAIKWGASVILSVPCCQHEVNKQMQNTPLDTLFKYGIIKERSAALFTDALRGNLLEQWGYKTQMLEFIDIEHTPKNILIRAIKSKDAKKIEYKSKVQKQSLGYQECLEFFGIEPTLHVLLEQYKQELE